MRPSPDRRDTGAAPDLPIGASVLVVDDWPLVREVVKRVLAANGYRVAVASGGDEALEYVVNGSDPVDLLLTDVHMEGMDGPSLAESARAERPGLPVLFMSGRPGAAPGLSPILAKPFGPTRLLSAVDRTLNGDGAGRP